MQVPDVLKPFMSEMREYGIVFALDDFGAGMTSLRTLQDLSFEIAKIDGSLVKHIDRLPDSQGATKAAIAIAQELGMYVVAEAVETEGEAQWLRQAGVGLSARLSSGSAHGDTGLQGVPARPTRAAGLMRRTRPDGAMPRCAAVALRVHKPQLR
jgi:predicted signal transduction protein with EAL and GGDEF domain